ncbi:MAG TPA: HepT-like ribonuclease domain-containing protein [Candidatus Limnocylindria bacterium]|nr:HepT-like ribonuclease domain-containing protein [Candidatus Limnocylindria bacterium]
MSCAGWSARVLRYIDRTEMDLFERQAQLHSLFQRSPVDAAYTQGSASGRRLAGNFSEVDVALLLLDKVKANEFFDYQIYFVGELSKTLETEGLDVVILNQASLLQRAQVIRSWSILYQRDEKRRVQWETRAVMDYLDFQKYDDLQTKALAERTKSDRFAIDREYVRARLVRLREYTQLLRDLRAIDHVKFKSDPKLYGLAQWYLQQAVELLFGTGAYLVMALALPRPEAYHDILDAVAGHGIIERPLAYRLEHLANLRNLLAYDREQTDIDDVYAQIQTRLTDLGSFADQVERFVGAGEDA